MLSLKDFDYNLPKELIAPYPERKRSEAKLLIVDRKSRRLEHRVFKELTAYLKVGDLLVLNNTKVLPARLFGRKPTGGRVEALLLKKKEEAVWEILLRPSGRVKKGMQLAFGENGTVLEGEVLDDPSGDSGVRRIRFFSGDGSLREPSPVEKTLNQIGRIPLPPYIDRPRKVAQGDLGAGPRREALCGPDEAIDRELYQTVFAQVEGAVASPTAGLHFDETLLDLLKKRGVEICFVTLHVSYGTFQRVTTEDLSKHKIYEEEFGISGEAARQINRALKEKRRIVACGTTVVRVLETVGAPLQPLRGTTRLFIYPPYEFKIVDAMITNFHLPRSTLLMLVSAFAGRELVFQAYEEAIREQYRFYSYGDAMLIL